MYFSSTAPLIVLPGTAAYAAANAFLDALATQRRKAGDNTTAIAWTVWRDMGLGQLSDDGMFAMRTQGFGDVTASEARQAWDFLQTTDDGYAVVMRPTQAPQQGRSPLFEQVIDAVIPGAEGKSAGSARLLRALPGEQVFEAAMQEIQRQVTVVTGLNVERVTGSRPFTDMGIDSVMSVSIRGRLQQATGLELPASVMWTHTTPEALARYMQAAIAEG